MLCVPNDTMSGYKVKGGSFSSYNLQPQSVMYVQQKNTKKTTSLQINKCPTVALSFLPAIIQLVDLDLVDMLKFE